MAVGDRQTFRDGVLEMTQSWIWELANQAQHRVPDPVDYLEMRRSTFGSNLTMGLARVTHGQDLPPEIHRTTAMQAIESSAADYACLVNDAFSYRKEIEFEGELHNGVLVVQQFLGCKPAEAMSIVNDLMTARIKQFEQVATTDLPVLARDFELSPQARAGLAGYVGQLRDWMAGVLNWHRGTRRYTDLRSLPVGIR